jgi:hypothetical protein
MLCICTVLICIFGGEREALYFSVTCPTPRSLRFIGSIDLLVLPSQQKSDLLKHSVNLHTCDCTSPFSVTAQCVDADIPKNISDSRTRILRFKFITSFYCSLTLIFIFITAGKKVSDGNIMNDKYHTSNTDQNIPTCIKQLCLS